MANIPVSSGRDDGRRLRAEIRRGGTLRMVDQERCLIWQMFGPLSNWWLGNPENLEKTSLKTMRAAISQYLDQACKHLQSALEVDATQWSEQGIKLSQRNLVGLITPSDKRIQKAFALPFSPLPYCCFYLIRPFVGWPVFEPTKQEWPQNLCCVAMTSAAPVAPAAPAAPSAPSPTRRCLEELSRLCRALELENGNFKKELDQLRYFAKGFSLLCFLFGVSEESLEGFVLMRFWRFCWKETNQGSNRLSTLDHWKAEEGAVGGPAGLRCQRCGKPFLTVVEAHIIYTPWWAKQLGFRVDQLEALDSILEKKYLSRQMGWTRGVKVDDRR